MTESTKHKLSSYDRAIAELPDEVLTQRHREYIEFCNKHLTPIKQKMHLLRIAQRTVLKPGPKDKPFQAEQVIKWTPESKRRMEELMKEQDQVYRIAENKFWKGYEHLRPGYEEDQLDAIKVNWIRNRSHGGFWNVFRLFKIIMKKVKAWIK